MITVKRQKTPNKLICEKCNFMCSKKSDFNRHILTAKHLKITDDNEKTLRDNASYKCNCGSSYKFISGLSRHKQKCAFQQNEKINEESSQEIQNTNENNIDYKDMFLEMMKENRELHKTIHEMIPKIGNNNNNTTTNNNNQQFNLQMFLNEDCKNAQNITDFMKSIQVNMNDLIQTGKLGYVEGMSRIFVKALNDMDVTERPIHCTDIKRETVYIKDQDKWAKDEDDKIKIKKTIQNIENKNIRMLPKWQDENPDCMDMESKKSEELTDLSIIVLGGHEEREKSEKKIMKNVLKEVMLDKK